MAGQGPAPKAQRARAYDNHALTELHETGDWYGPELPDAAVLPYGDEDWHPMTRKWWDALRGFPLLKDEPELGWAFLMDTALMHHTMWSKGRWEFAAEIRLRVAKYGATPEDRMRLKIKVVTPEAELPARPLGRKVSDISARRARITG